MQQYTNVLWIIYSFLDLLWGGRNRTNDILDGRCLKWISNSHSLWNYGEERFGLTVESVSVNCCEIRFDIWNIETSKCLWYLSKILAFEKLTVILTFRKKKKKDFYLGVQVIFSSCKVNPCHFFSPLHDSVPFMIY